MIATATRTIPLLDLQAQHRSVGTEILEEIRRVVDSQHFILGEVVKAFERRIGSYCSAKYAVGCASGSDALFLALLAANIGRGDKVLTTPYTFFATAGAICRTGATPVFADIEARTFNIDPALLPETLAANPEIRAVIPVHLFGGCADMDAIRALVADRDIAVVEDAAQSIGSEYNGRRAGSLGDAGCFSFFPSKNLGAYGDGGLVTTNDAAMAEKLGALRVHGSKQKYYHEWIGINSRLDALQAAVLDVKLRYLDQWTAARQLNADRYRAMLHGIDAPVTLPAPAPYQTRHIYNQFVICVERRNELQAYLKQHGIGTEVYYPLPMHLQKCFSHLGYRKGEFPVSEQMADTSLALPVYPELTADDIEYVCEAIRTFYGR
jgi:dTDP-4-amino-4,6-dideoxygalactose transaminase